MRFYKLLSKYLLTLKPSRLIMKDMLLIIIGFLACIPFAFGVSAGSIADEAGVLSPEYESDISKSLAQLKVSSGVDMAVVTMSTTGGIPIQELSKKLAIDAFGESGADPALLLLLAVENKEYIIYAVGGAREIISASVAERVGTEYMEPYFIKGNYDEGVYMGVYAIKGVFENDGAWETQLNNSNNPFWSWNLVLLIFIFVIFVFIALFLGKRFSRVKTKPKRAGRKR